MLTPPTLQLRWRHVQLLLLSTLFCVVAGSEDLGCHDPDLNITRSLGEQWLLPNCGGLATCEQWYTSVTSCPRPDACRIADEGDPSAPFPRCCPRLACEGCQSQDGRFFHPGSTWTEGHCVRRRCKIGLSGALQRYAESCEPLGPPPSLDCEVVEQDMARGEYPLCCAYYRCPGLCRSGDVWQPADGLRGDSCDKVRTSAASWLGWN